MQTLRKRTSPCKYKNEPSRFLGEGITYKAKLIGILEVSEARGDKMCQDALNDLKTAIRAAGEHKQRITISISIDGLRLRDEKTGDCLYHHPVHKISFIAQDMSDSRAFGYIFGSPDTGHRFFGIKTDKTASQVVISMRDLFQVVFELKKKEIEMAKHHSEQHHLKYGSTGYMDSIHFSKDENDPDKSKGKYSQLLKSRCLSSKSGEGSTSDYKGPSSEAIADLLDLEHELNSIQQGINQMDKITPSDPFGPLAKGEPYVDPFDDSFSSSKVDKPPEEKISLKNQTYPEDSKEPEKHSSFFGSTTSSAKANFFTQFSPGIGKPKADDGKWFDQETESLFSETVNANNAEPTSSPITLNTSAPEPDQVEGRKSPIKTDLFTELDPLGTGRVKPYVDKKDFFQELKNPPKKVLKEMITDNTVTEVPSFYFPTSFKEEKSRSTKAESGQSISDLEQTHKEPTSVSKFSRIDPFEDSDPFEKTDPFQEEKFPSSVGFPPLFGVKSSTDSVFDDKLSWKFDQNSSREEKPGKTSPTNLPFFPSSTLRVSLPPEKTDVSIPLSLSTITSKLKSSPDSPEDSKSTRRKCYQSLKQSALKRSDESPIHEEPFVCTKITNFASKSEERRSPFKEKFYSVQSPPPSRSDKGNAKMYSSVEILEVTTPDPPPRAKTALFSIKPPPLPPKKQSQPVFRPPARPPSLEESNFQYDYLEKKENGDETQFKEELKCVQLKKQLFTGKDSPPTFELKKQNSDTTFPLLPPPPHRRTSSDNSNKTILGRKADGKSRASVETPGSVLNLKLNQLDNTGLENLAITLGIPSENIYCMTLQELTKMLADKYLNSKETKVEESKSETFEADFDANFGKSEVNPPPTFDKYAVFKELIESENKVGEINVNSNEFANKEEPESATEKTPSESVLQEEDKYAALRQLSLNTQKSENFSEEEEKSVKTGPLAEELPSSATTNSDLAAGVPDIKSQWQLEALERKNENIEGKSERSALSQEPDTINTPEQKTPKEKQFSSDSQLFPLVDQFSDEKKPNSPRENWATFEKTEFEERTKSADNFNENENSPFSSDGKEEVREIPFHWHQNTFRKRTRKDVPWQDDDESWDDYSPKESYCSDESSHEERSPEVGRDNRYEKPWNVCGRPLKSDRMWNEKSGQWNRRDKWQEETEDEFEETWRKQRERISSYDADRKGNVWHNSHEGYSKRYEWCNSRDEPWDENDRYGYYYGTRRKRSESDNEYRKRCDSDASDKECVWTFQKTYADGRGRSGKQKQYHSSAHAFRDCSEHCHESRTKHRKGAPQKRPSSASESKRSYEKMSSPGNYSCRGFDKTYPGKREPDKEEYSRYQYCKDTRYRGDGEFSRYYSSFDRKSGHQTKMGNRGLRTSSSAQGDTLQSPNKRGEEAEDKTRDFGYFEPFTEKNFKYGKPETHFAFDSESENFEKTKKSVSDQEPQPFAKTPDKRFGNQWASANGKSNGDGFYAGKNNNDNFANFKEEFSSPRKLKENGRTEPPPPADTAKPPPKAKNHLSLLTRQDSSTALRKSDSINIFSRDKDPFEGDDFFSNVS